MPAAALPVLMNIALAALFAASFAAIAFLYPRERGPIWFAASYAMGMLTPVAQIGLASGVWVPFFGAMVFLTFAGGLLLTVPGLAVFYRRPIPRHLVGALVATTLAVAVFLAISAFPNGLDRNSLLYTEVYQLPFMLAMLAGVWVVLSSGQRRAGDVLLVVVLTVSALHFPLKAMVAARLGTGMNPANYVLTPYAVLSQVSTGILLAATGLVLLINAVLAVVRETQAAAETDSLSGVLNRRGFEERASRALAEEAGGGPAALLLLDIDHFKRVNDTYGHAGGDDAIRWLAGLLVHMAPKSAVVGRLGGEEFGVLLGRTTREIARLQAEAIREAVRAQDDPDVPAMTVSIGVTDLWAGEPLRAAIERADAALYAAKRGGRDQVCLAPAADEGELAGNVVTLHHRGDA